MSIVACPLDDTLPQHPDSDTWPHVMMAGSQQVGADTATELIHELIGNDYADQDTDEQFGLRLDHAVTMATMVQTSLVEQALGEGALNPHDQLALTAASADKYEPLPLHLLGGGPLAWEDRPFPLIVVATSFKPFQSQPLPTGDVVVLDPHTEDGYLASLSTLGVVHYLRG